MLYALATHATYIGCLTRETMYRFDFDFPAIVNPQDEGLNMMSPNVSFLYLLVPIDYPPSIVASSD